MNARAYLQLIEQHTGVLPVEESRRVLALAKGRGGRGVLQELDWYTSCGWRWQDWLAEAESCWPQSIHSAQNCLLQSIIAELEGELQHRDRSP